VSFFTFYALADSVVGVGENPMSDVESRKKGVLHTNSQIINKNWVVMFEGLSIDYQISEGTDCK
jgi:hypothetical protein